MTRPSPPALTVRYDGSPRTFSPGNDVVVGRDLRADVRVAHPLISRAHVLLRFDQGRWMAIDNGSLNGLWVNGQRVPMVDLTDGMGVNLGNPDGPRLTFEVGRHQGSAGTPPQTTAVPVAQRPGTSWQSHPPSTGYPRTQPGPPRGQSQYPSGPQQQPSSRSQPMYPSGPTASAPHTYGQPSTQQPAYPTAPDATAMGPTAAPRAPESNLATSMLKILRPGRTPEVPAGGVKIGRATDNDIVIPDVLGIPSPRDPGFDAECGRHRRSSTSSSINGTFVNGQRVDSVGDLVTTATWSPSATSTSSSAAAPWRAATNPMRRPAPAASTSTRSASPSTIDGKQDSARPHLAGRAPGHADRASSARRVQASRRSPG
jgi:pSer/pThr/pTyr-binding forkhead associated (FHA) protein